VIPDYGISTNSDSESEADEPDDENENDEVIMRTEAVTPINRYFNRPKGPEYDDLTIRDYYEKFIVRKLQPGKPMPQGAVCDEVETEKHIVYKRSRKAQVARIEHVPFQSQDKWFARQLLLHKPARSTKEMLTIDDKEYKTYQEAAVALGIVGDGEEYNCAMMESIELLSTPDELRNLFTVLIMNKGPAPTLWEKFKDEMSEDFIDNSDKYKQALGCIRTILETNGGSYSSMSLPHIQRTGTQLSEEQARYNTNSQKQIAQDRLETLTDLEQKPTFHEIISAVTNPDYEGSKMFWIDGPAGTGKSYLLNTITAHLRGIENVCLCTASTGVAALQYPFAYTMHNLFKLNCVEDINDECRSKIMDSRVITQRMELLQKASLIILDESAMQDRRIIDAIDQALQKITGETTYFGGKVVVFAGDHRQSAPVIPGGTPIDALKMSIISLPLWNDIKIRSLTIAQRDAGDPEYSQMVRDIGNNLLPRKEVNGQQCIAVPNVQFTTDTDHLITQIYPTESLQNPRDLLDTAILCTTNEAADSISETINSRLTGTEKCLLSADSMLDPCSDIPDEFLHSANRPGVPPHKLKLKVGSMVMLLRNINLSAGLANGKVMIVKTIRRHIVICEIRTVLPDGGIRYKSHNIPRILFDFKPGPQGMTIRRHQFPMKLAYGRTISKSQGATLNRVGLDVRNPCFAHGMLYVGMGRVRNRTSITLLTSDEYVVDGVPHTVNTVIPQLITASNAALRRDPETNNDNDSMEE
jgi:hypothetical protein